MDLRWKWTLSDYVFEESSAKLAQSALQSIKFHIDCKSIACKRGKPKTRKSWEIKSKLTIYLGLWIFYSVVKSEYTIWYES